MLKPYDKSFGSLSQWLKANNLTMHTPLKGPPFFRPKPPKK